MKKLIIFTFVVAACSLSFATSRDEGALVVSLTNGVELRISPQISSYRNGSIVRGSVAAMSPKTVQRVFMDEQRNLLFGYDIEAKANTSTLGAVVIQIKPLNVNVLKLLHSTSSNVTRTEAFPTFAEMRQLGPLRIGETALVVVPSNTVADQQITDQITITKIPADIQADKESHRVSQMFHLTGLSVFVNAKDVTGTELPGAIVGRFISLYIPEIGAYSLSTKPQTGMRQIGEVRSSKLIIHDGENTIECRSQVPILENEGVTPLWVAYNPDYRPTPLKFNGVVTNPHPERDIEISVSDSAIFKGGRSEGH